MRRVGLIVNPQSGKDVRRIVGGGSTASYQDKVDLTRRVITGLVGADVEEVLLMPDPTDLASRTLGGLDSGRQGRCKILGSWADGSAEDTDRAVEAMQSAPCGCIITVGGDGTHRRVARLCGPTPLLPLPGGTNNVFCEPLDGLVAGLAAGAFMKAGRARGDLCWRGKRLAVERNEAPFDEALIDVAVSDHGEIGARAIWEADRLKEVVLSQGLPTRIGLSAIGGMLEPLGPRESGGLHIRLNPRGKGGCVIRAGILSGVLAKMVVERVVRLEDAETVSLPKRTGALALDGEREILMRREESWQVRLDREGPWIIDVEKTLREAVARNWLNGMDPDPPFGS
ncbi:MAG: NAD(+)/NADH kinase [Nitrospinota bacterium]|jgi:predicted polyphosphate/ATP-dependent NAD kinase|nr:NAD(+)/NADH kinase [Nitrospinota bacterium]